MSNIDKQAQGEKTREAFERWAEQSGALPWGILKNHRNHDGTYPGPHYTYMWHAWNACHEALLDELEAKDKQIDDLKATAAHSNAGWKEAHEQEARAEAAEKRIAELEARDKPKFVQCWSCKHDIEVLAIADCDGYCPRCAAPIDLDDEPYAAAGKGE